MFCQEIAYFANIVRLREGDMEIKIEITIHGDSTQEKREKALSHMLILNPGRERRGRYYLSSHREFCLSFSPGSLCLTAP